jgi:hypothetical protein
MAPVVDIMEALKQSLEKAKAKKPVQSVVLAAEAEEKAAKPRRAGKKSG